MDTKERTKAFLRGNPIRVDQKWGLSSSLTHELMMDEDRACPFRFLRGLPGYQPYLESRVAQKWSTSGRFFFFNHFPTEQTLQRCMGWVRGDGHVYSETLECEPAKSIQDFMTSYFRNEQMEQKIKDMIHEQKINMNLSDLPVMPPAEPDEIPVCVIKNGKLHGTEASNMYYWQFPMILQDVPKLQEKSNNTIRTVQTDFTNTL